MEKRPTNPTTVAEESPLVDQDEQVIEDDD